MPADAAHNDVPDTTTTTDDFDASLRRSRTRRALAGRRAAQRRRRTRSGTGAFGAAILAIVLAAPLSLANATRTGHAVRLLTAGSRGDDVTAIQRALGVTATGRYDARTRRAVRGFQRRRHLIVDGIVGPQTRRALGLASAPASAASRSSAPAVHAPSGTLKRIARCESGGNPRAVSPSGRYRGKYQFSRATWRALGGSGDPAAAPEALQDRMAARLLARSGTAPWPSCA